MHRLKLSFVGLIGSLAALFSIGRLIAAPFDAVSTPAGVHFLTVGLVLALILTRLSERVPVTFLITGTAVAYISSLAFVADPTRSWSGASALVTALEVALASAAILFAVGIAGGLNQFEDSITTITLDELSGVTTLEDARDDISIEMSRARRHERPLTVTVLWFDPQAVHASLHQIVRDVQQRMMQRYIMSGLSRVAAQTTRRGDIVVQDPAANRVIVLSPESTPEQLDALTSRLQASAYQSLGIPVRFGRAGFPATALTFDDLVARASGDAANAAELGDSGRRTPVRIGVGADGTVRTLYRKVGDASSHSGDAARAVNGD